MSIIMHIDVNSAFLAWTSAYEKQIGINRDLLQIASVCSHNGKDIYELKYEMNSKIWYLFKQ